MAADEAAALDAISEASKALRTASSRLERSRQQKALLQRRGGLMLNKKAQSIEDLEELERLEDSREAGASIDPDSAERDRQAKRLRSESSADTVAVGLN